MGKPAYELQSRLVVEISYDLVTLEMEDEERGWAGGWGWGEDSECTNLGQQSYK